jgi:MscS family membrane protein
MIEFLQNLPLIEQMPPATRLIAAQVLIAVALVAIFWLLRGLAARLLLQPIKRYVARSQGEIDDALFHAFEGAAGLLVLGVGIYFGTQIIDFDPLWRELLSRGALTLALVGFFQFVFFASEEITSTSGRLQRFTGLRIKYSLVRVVNLTVKGAVIVLAAVMIPQIWNLSIAGLIAGLGLGGLALSLAAKDVLDDFVGFINIVGDDPFTLNEYIVSPHGEGIVEQIGLRSTRIRRLDQALVVVPNSLLVNDSILNWSRLTKRWLNFSFGVTYDANAGQMRDLIGAVSAMLKVRPQVDPDSVVVFFEKFEDSALTLLIRCYIRIADWTQAQYELSEINLELMRIVDELGMSVAFPTRTLYIEGLSGDAARAAAERTISAAADSASSAAAVPPSRSPFPQGDDDPAT